MANTPRTGYVAECFWPDVREKDLRGLDGRIEAALGAVAVDGEPVRYLGWLLVIDDEVVLVMFEGPIGTVRRVAEHAEIPFGRILRVTRPPSPPDSLTGEEPLP
jgi:hypothetical protein